ncbi:DNA topoisomerase-3 [Salsuginibacillus halophilus]|uniref:DNA topoisomerase n=1 Tax=Salsuginibacillus halophilus TaxID=517424 RepID=A0A2P8HI03_9BACI|nr:type IA DNA topoisomerase [Salsuginibacillus halophilus]PSL45848.1 DNA topoisomerase-3 [Salsuginibacillus halophilus]
MTTVLLCEKKIQAEAIAKAFPTRKTSEGIDIKPCEAFPSGALIVWASGHLLELEEPEGYDAAYKTWKLGTLPILPERFRSKVSKFGMKQYRNVKPALQKASHIVIACDPGREGAAIGYSIVAFTGQAKKPVSYLWTQSLTPKAVQEAASKLRSKEETYPLYQAAHARAVSDWLVGINLTRAYSLLINQQASSRQGVFSVGRVQTPLLSLIAALEQEIRDFQKEPYWECRATFQYGNEVIEGKWTNGETHRILEQHKADNLAVYVKDRPAVIEDRSTSAKTYQPPQFYHLSSLLAAANERLKMPTKVTERALQSLYESGFVSYPRTDSRHVTPAEAATFPKVIKALGELPSYAELVPEAKEKPGKRYIDASKVSDHYAIIPTEQVPDPAKLKNDEVKVYDLIARSLLAAHYPVQKVEYEKLISVVDERFRFLTEGQRELQTGWRHVIPASKQDDDVIPDLQTQKGTVINAEVDEKETKPPKRYTQGSLRRAMEKHHLGTEATRSGIIDTLEKRGYITFEKNQAAATAKGELLINCLGSGSILTDVETTQKWEEYLTKVGAGERSADPFVNQTRHLVTQLVQEAKAASGSWNVASYETKAEEAETVGTCPSCGGVLKDKKAKKKTFIGCSGYRQGCLFSLPRTVAGKKLTDQQVQTLLTKGKTNTLKGFKGKKGKFSAALQLTSEGKITFI